MTERKIELIRLNDKIKSEYLSLEVHDFQKSFIETPKGSLDDMEKSAWDIKWTIECIFSGNQMIGYAMHGMNKRKDVWFDRFMIDKKFQNMGYGRQAFAKILELLKELYPSRQHILLSVEPDNKTAIKLYESFGFYLTGDIEDGESVMMLKE